MKQPSYYKLLFIGLFSFLYLNLFAQTPKPTDMQNYKKDWEIINKQDKDGLPKSALKSVEKLYEKIKKDKDNPFQSGQLIKALLFMNKYQVMLEEDGLVKAIYRFEEEIKTSSMPVRPVLESMLAEMYDQYLNYNLYKFRNRTEVLDYDLKDIRTWDIPKITNRCYELFNASIVHETSKKVELSQIEAITYNIDDSQGIHPTLYDFLQHRAIDFFQSEKYYLTKPAFKFYVEQEEVFADANTFINYKFEAKDSLSTAFQTILCFQQLLAFHINDEDPRAFLHTELRRLSYAKEKSILTDKNERYYQALENLAKKYADHPAVAEVLYYQALYHREKGNSYSPSPLQVNRWEQKKALEIAQSAIDKYPDSYGASHCKVLAAQIKAKGMRMNMEKIYAIDENILLSLDYENLDQLHIKVIELPAAKRKKYDALYGEEQIKYLNNQPVIQRKSMTLPNEGDFQTHRIEAGLAGLKTGFYLVVASENKDFQYLQNGQAICEIHVSNLSYFSRQKDGYYEYFVSDRNTGKPLKGVDVRFFEEKYNSLFKKHEWRKVHAAKTDSSGFIKTKQTLNKDNYYSHQYRLKLDYQGDYLYLDDRFYNYRYSEDNKTRYSTHFFLDRAIYRPGQTVYFKGIIIKTDDAAPEKPEIVKNYETEVIFYDANYQELARVPVKTNEYGSYQGSFNAPLGGMLGSMNIKDVNTNSQKHFRVEEYKRPKFEVNFEPLNGSFKLQEKVKVTGFAKAFAGNSIDGAKVSYRVVRKAHFPYWPWWRWGWYNPYNQQQQEIRFGELKTDEEGKFEIEFNAIPDRSIPAERQPQFSYTVYADVVDITGETHSSQVSVQVGYVALNAYLQLSDNLNKDNTKDITIKTLNLNGEFEAAKGNIKIEKLKTPENGFKKRYWAKPDYFLLSEADFQTQFPGFAYKNEDEVQEWAVEKEMLSSTFDSEKSSKLELEMSNWSEGKYKATLSSADKFGTPVEKVHYFTLYDASSKVVPMNDQLFLANSNFYGIEPGQELKLEFGSVNKSAWLLLEVEKNQEIIHRQWVQPNGRAVHNLNIKEEDRGNLHFHLSSIQNNRFYENGGTVYVPWSNKKLNIEYSSFREKLYPGQEEEWSIKISGSNKEAAAAEVLAGMYDASLDAFAANYWSLSLYPSSYRQLYTKGNQNFKMVNSQLIEKEWNERLYGQSRSYPSLNWHGFSFYDHAYYEGKRSSRSRSSKKLKKSIELSAKMESPGAELDEVEEESDGFADSMVTEDKVLAQKPEELAEKTKEDEDFEEVKVRTNLNETVFFFPNLLTDEEGNVIIKFTMNEALTRWKFMTLAHSKDLSVASEIRELVTQKDLMVMPNAPRFFRQGDELFFSAKVSNLTEEKMTGQAILQLFNALTMESVDIALGNANNRQDFVVEGGRSAALVWKLNIPADWTDAITHRVIAKSGDFSDGEESSLPVLSNRMLVTETMPLPVRGGQSKNFEFKRMKTLTTSNTLKHHQYSLEFTQNPAWYAIQSLPYLMEYPHECTEQVFSRYYANSLASEVANAHPKIKRVFEAWKNIDTDALKSNLSKNQELKYALLEETPWVLDAQSEEQQKKNIGLLFDLNRMAMEQDRDRDKIADRQLASGGFSWFPGGRENWYITQYIMEGMGHLDQLGVKTIKKDPKMATMVNKAVHYCDDQLARRYKELLKAAKRSEMGEKAYLKLDHLGYMAMHFMYMRSFFPEIAINNKTTLKALEYYEGQAAIYWNNKSMYMKGLLVLGLHRKNIQPKTISKIIANLSENALHHEEMGMYWKYPSGYYWYQAPIETHALMIEVFDEVAKDSIAVDDLKVWLLKNKQTSNWKTTKATAAAVYALLRRGDNWLMDDKEIEIHIGGQLLDQSNIKKEAGTGYFKTTWAAQEIKNEMADIKVHNPNKVVAWGAVYWQYFEQLDKITHFEETPLKIDKKLFKEIKTDRGLKLIPITDTNLEPGDLIKVRIEIRVDRDMEFVHMKDQRAAGLEPINVLSQFKYQGGLGYYESTKDAATHFFIDYLSKGTYVFEYPLRVNHKGDFSNGVTTLQCMYAPEFTSHSEGVRIKVK